MPERILRTTKGLALWNNRYAEIYLKATQGLGAGHTAALKCIRLCDLINRQKQTERTDGLLIWNRRQTFVVQELTDSNGVQADWCYSTAGVSLTVREQCRDGNLKSSANAWLGIWSCWEIQPCSLVALGKCHHLRKASFDFQIGIRREDVRGLTSQGHCCRCSSALRWDWLPSEDDADHPTSWPFMKLISQRDICIFRHQHNSKLQSSLL